MRSYDFILHFSNTFIYVGIWKWYKKTVIISFLGTFLYACSDEFHQLFIYGRSGEFRDVMIDSTGGIIGLLLIIFIVKYKQINKKIEK